MKRCQRSAGPTSALFDAPMLWGVVWTGLTMALATLATIDLYLPGGLIAGVSSEDGDLATARTASFTVLVLAQLFNCFNARSETASAFRNLFVNRWLWGAITLSAMLQVAVVHFPPLNLAFGTAPLSLQQWAVCAGMASGGARGEEGGDCLTTAPCPPSLWSDSSDSPKLLTRVVDFRLAA